MILIYFSGNFYQHEVSAIFFSLMNFNV